VLRHVLPRTVEDYRTFTSHNPEFSLLYRNRGGIEKYPRRSTTRLLKLSVDWRVLTLGHSDAERTEAHGVDKCLPEAIAESWELMAESCRMLIVN
jgi:hypothetical protein